MLIKTLQCNRCGEQTNHAYEINVDLVDADGICQDVPNEIDDIRYKTFSNFHLCEKCVKSYMSGMVLMDECGLPFTAPTETIEELVTEFVEEEQEHKAGTLTKEELKILLDSGKTVKEISEQSGMKLNSVYKLIYRYELKPKKECPRQEEVKKVEKPKPVKKIPKLRVGEAYCYVCGKVFYIGEVAEWAYKGQKGRVCSYTCMRADERK